MSKDNISSFKHDKDKRASIPSQEEAGMESANPSVKEGKKVLDLPKNPVVHRGQDPELFWLGKYGDDEQDDRLKVDIRSLYRHEHIAPEALIQVLQRTAKETTDDEEQLDLFSTPELFGNTLEKDELEKVGDYYKHSDGWSNRLIQGDSLLVMSSLLEREGMAGKVQCIYFDPPYGIKYGGNWQMKITDKKMKDTDTDDQISGEPEMIKAYRDTWEFGIHSYLSYIRDRLLISKNLLSTTGSIFLQISDDNYHLVRTLLDEVFGSDCFIVSFPVKKKGGQKSSLVDPVNDYLIWYSKSPRTENYTKYRNLFVKRSISDEVLENGFSLFELDGEDQRISQVKTPDGSKYDYLRDIDRLLKDYPKGRIFKADQLQSGGVRKNQSLPFTFNGRTYSPKTGNCWKTKVVEDGNQKPGMEKLAECNRLYATPKALYYRRYLNDFEYKHLSNWWDGLGGVSDAKYVVQTNTEIVKRCILMTTDPGDLVLDPTCGSGTTAFVAEQWGRRWITIDTSRIALNIAKTRLMTATYPYYHLHSDVNVEKSHKDGKIKKKVTEKPATERGRDIRQGFVYEEVPHITLKSLANDEPPATETLYDQPFEDKKRLRVTGPFTVETLQHYDPVAPDQIAASATEEEELQAFEAKIYEHLKTAGIKNGIKDEQAVFTRIEALPGTAVNAQGYYETAEGERKAYFHIGPKFGTVSKRAVNDAVKECRLKGDSDWLVILGFSFQDNIQNTEEHTDMGVFQVTKVRMHDDLLQDGLMKKDKKAGSFITIGEPDIAVHREDGDITLEVEGLDIYDPIKDEVKARSAADIAYWMVDDDYDGTNFVVKQIFFCGGDKKEFDKWRKGLDSLAKQSAKKKAEKTLRIEIDEEAFDRLYGFKSHPITPKEGNHRVAVRVVSQFGEESTRVIEL